MKKTIKLLSLVLTIGVLALTNSCGLLGGDDDDGPKIDDGGGDPIVADGLYMIGTASGEDAVANNQFGQGYRNIDGTVTGVPGMFEAYIYLNAGSMQFVSYVGNEGTPWGGTTTATDALEGEDLLYTFLDGDLAEGGAAVTIAAAGLYHVALDLTVNKFYVVPVSRIGVIGTSTIAGWGYPDVQLMSQGVTADGGTWESTEVILRLGEYKFRINNSWDIPEEIDDFNVHKDFGDDGAGGFIQGGSNFSNTNEGAYTVTATWAPGQGMGMSFSLLRTGDAPEVTFDPAEYAFGVIGSATAGGWDADRDIKYIGNVDTGHTWGGVVYLGTGEFKLRTNDAWDFNLGSANLAVGAGDVAMDRDGANAPNPADTGAYYIEVFTADEGTNWGARISPAAWGAIGAATPGGWDGITPLNADGFAGGVTTYSGSVAMTAGEYKFRANDDTYLTGDDAWLINLGGALDALVWDGGNLSVGADGTYDVVLSFDGTNYTATVTAQ